MVKKIIITIICVLLFSVPFFIAGDRTPQEGAVFSEEKLRGVWLASVYNIDFPSAQLTAEEQKKVLVQKLDCIKATGLNTVFFQVRPTADALYKSSVYPWSKWVVGEQGEECSYDPLQFLIDEGKKRGIAVHAWINPYRITTGAQDNPAHDVSVLAENSPARLHPNWTVNFADGRMYFDPGIPEVTNLIVDGVMELVRNYEIAGIHFDDYYYPYINIKDADGKSTPAVFDDKASFETYGNGRTLEQFRRDNTYNMVKTVYETIKAEKPSVSFGVSPFGVWASKDEMPEGSDTNGGYSSYTQQYADTRKWVKDGIVDYIVPQIYWTIGADKTDYEVLLKWWSDTVKDTGVSLYIGHAAYKVGDENYGGKWMQADQLLNQIKLSRGMGCVSGCVFYGLSCIEENKLGIADSLETFFSKSGTVENLTITYPEKNLAVNQSHIMLMGTADGRYPLFCNGQQVTVTSSGFFAYYTALIPGENAFIFSQNGQGYTHTVVRETLTFHSDIAPQTAMGEGWVVLTGNEKITLSFLAPKGAKVWVNIGDNKLSLTAAKGSNESVMTTYSGTFTAVDIVESGLQFVGKPSYTVEKDRKTITKEINTSLFVYGRQKDSVAVLQKEDVGIYSGPSYQNEKILVLNRGVTDTVIGESKEFYQLSMGGWVSKNAVKIQKEILPLRKVTAVTGVGNAFETRVSFEMPYYAPYRLEVTNDKARLTLIDADGIEPKSIVPWHTLFESVSYSKGDDAVYTFMLKKYKGFYGYRTEYKNGKLTFIFKNPVRVESGEKPLSGIDILVDAGHGGTESGAAGPGGTSAMLEKDLNLKVAMYLREELQAMGANVIMTRENDDTVTLEERRKMIQGNSPVLSVSIHHNSVDFSADVSKYEGMLTLYTMDFSKPLAQAIQNAVVGTLERKDEGIRVQSLAVCRLTDCPAVLLELGYMCNPDEYEYLSKDETMHAEAKAVAQGIMDYLS